MLVLCITKVFIQILRVLVNFMPGSKMLIQRNESLWCRMFISTQLTSSSVWRSCVSKEAESDRELGQWFRGYFWLWQYSECSLLQHMPFVSRVCPASFPKHMHQAADIWSMCRWIYMLSPIFQKQFYRLGGFQVCHKLIFMVIQELFRNPGRGAREKGRR